MSVDEGELEGRIQLMGIYPSAQVIKGSFWPSGRKVSILHSVLLINFK